jgi:GAF domain-containing protein
MTQSPSVSKPNDNQWRQTLLLNTLRGALILGGLAIIAAWPNNDWPTRIIFLSAWSALLLVTVLPVPYLVRAGVCLVLLYGLSYSEFFTVGIRDNAKMFLYACSMMALVFFSWRTSILILAINVITLAAMGALYILGPLAYLGDSPNVFFNSDWSGLIDTVVSFTLLNFLPIIGLALFQREFTSSQQRERAALDAVRQERNQLEATVAERTGQLQAVADIGRAAISVRDRNQLALTSVKLIQERFALYWTGLFLVNDQGDQVVLTQGLGHNGQSIITPGFALGIGSGSLIGWVAQNRKARIARDVAEDQYYAKHPLLPETRAETALPLLVGDKLLGILDLQSRDLDAFAESNLRILQTLADQLSIAFENAQLFEQAQASITEASTRFDQTLTDAWQGAARNQPQEFIYELEPGQSDPNSTPIEIPLRLGGEIIGTIELHDRNSPLTPEEEAALGTLSTHIGTALESATLFQEAQRRAEQLATASEVGRAASSVLDPNALIVRAAELIQERFNLYYVGIFIADDHNQWAELRYATGEAGRQLLALKHRLEIGGQSMVGTAIATGQARVVFDVGQEAVRFNNPYLPDTHSEVALPLVVGTAAIGALDVQSTDYAAFSQADLTVLQTMADQLAVAIQNARQFERTQQRVQFEQFINQFTAKLRRVIDTDSIMNVAMSELRTALRARRIVAQLGPEILPASQAMAPAAPEPAGQDENLTPVGKNGKSSGNGHRPGSNGHSNGNGHQAPPAL